MFLNETGLAEEFLSEKQIEQWKDDLLMVGLTPGDFATLKRQCILVGETLSPQEWLTQLQMECEARKALNRAEQERGTRLVNGEFNPGRCELDINVQKCQYHSGQSLALGETQVDNSVISVSF